MTRRKMRPRGLSLEEAFRWFMPGDPPPIEECWPWSAGSFNGRSGYGGMMFGDRCIGAHVVSYQVHHGEIPEGMSVLHDPALCNNSWCVHPLHLRVGTTAENMADKAISGTGARGETQHLAKVTAEQVLEIRHRASMGENQVDIGKLFGIGQSTVSAIVRRETWKHLAAESPHGQAVLQRP